MRKSVCKLTAGILTASMCVTVIPQIAGNGAVSADVTKNQSNTYLGTSVIARPDAPESIEAAWSGSYVYFGAFDAFSEDSVPPMLFRVLDPDTDKYGTRTMLLDSEYCIDQDWFDKRNTSWADSYIRDYLNSDFLSDAFTVQERDAIAASVISEADYPSGSFNEYSFGKSVPLTGEKVFLLDAGDIVNPDYGYSSDPGWINTDDKWSTQDADPAYYYVPNRAKLFSSGHQAFWWIRSAYCPQEQQAGCVNKYGHIGSDKISSIGNGIAPALNVNLDSVLFSSVVSGTAGQTGAAYKLTVTDDQIIVSLSAAANEGKTDGTTVTIPYKISGREADNVTRVSVLILDAEYSAGNANGAKILYYDSVGETSGTGTFKLPSSLSLGDWGSGYYVYLVAEEINGEYETDYASEPVMMPAPVFTGKNTWVQDNNIWHYYDENGSKVTGWKNINKSWYFFDSEGNMLDGWQQDGNTWYYLGGSGAMRTGWLQRGDTWYYLGSDGAMRTGWHQVGGVWYYFYWSGAMKTGWHQDGNTWYYFDGSGAMKTGWQEVKGKWYYFEDTGSMLTGWKYSGGTWYYMKDSGDMATGWLLVGGKWYYFYGSGAMAHSTTINGYELDDSGAMIE